MTDLRAAAEMALEALESGWNPDKERAIEALRQALEQPDMGIDRGAWSGVPDATKWVDELRGDEESEQEPVAWMYDFLNSDNRDEVIRNWVTQDIADIEREKGFNVRPLYPAPPSKPLVSLTGDDVLQLADIYLYSAGKNYGVLNFYKAIELKLKELNT